VRRVVYYAAFFLALAIGVNLNGQSKKEEILKKLMAIYENVCNNYVDSVDTYDLEEAAIIGMLKELDPHSKYFPRKRMSDVSDGLKGEFEGIGIETSTIQDTITILSVFRKGPAEIAGLKTGDRLLAIDGEPAFNLKGDALSNKLKGPVGSPVRMKVVRLKHSEPLTFTVVRDTVPIYSVDAAFIIDGTDVGYIRFKSFTAKAHTEVVDSINMLISKGMTKLIIDLHGNTGGYLNQACDIADEFIDGSQMMVYTKGRNHTLDKDYFSSNVGSFQNLPLIMLCDKWTASASEILIGAVQDLDRGLVIGETSFGKGLVQRQYRNDDGSGYRITTSRYYTPSGRCIQRPFDDKDKYEDFAGRYDLDEGSKLEDLIKKIEAELPKDSLPPMYKTKLGRTVIGAGGITPDYYVKYGNSTKLTDDLKRKKIMFCFAYNYYMKNETELLRKYKNDFTDFLRNFSYKKSDIEEFRKYAEKNDIYWDPDHYEKDRDLILAELKAELTRNIWSTNEYLMTMVPVTKQIGKAIELFPEAEKLAEMKP